MKKYKPTGCLKFLFFLIVFAPIAYLGASYARGEDGLGNLKKLLRIENSSIKVNENNSNQDKLIKNLKAQIKEKDAVIIELKEHLKSLEQREDGKAHK